MIYDKIFIQNKKKIIGNNNKHNNFIEKIQLSKKQNNNINNKISSELYMDNNK